MSERSDEDAVRHWWPGYWMGLLEGALLGGAVIGVLLLNWMVRHGCQ